MALTVTQSGGRQNSFPGVITAGVKKAGDKLGPALKGPIRYVSSFYEFTFAKAVSV